MRRLFFALALGVMAASCNNLPFDRTARVEYTSKAAVDNTKTMDSTISEIDLMVVDINDNEDMLHSNYTPAVHRLIEIGLPAVPRLLTAFVNGTPDTRFHAQTALGDIACTICGWKRGKEINPEIEDKIKELRKTLGPMNWKDDIETRRRSALHWRKVLLNEL